MSNANDPTASREAELLGKAAQFSFRARMDKKTNEGPIFERASGSLAWDVNGKEYIDFNSGQMCSALGHNHPTVTAAIKQACETMLHAHSSHYNVKEIELASRLGSIMPRPLQKSLFGESGADANEMAMMIARKYTGGYEIASPHISFHGLSDFNSLSNLLGLACRPRAPAGRLLRDGRAILLPLPAQPDLS